MITSTDLRREIRNIVQFCANECHRQMSGEKSVARMFQAYAYVVTADAQMQGSRRVDHAMILNLGMLIHSGNNNGFRTTPVTFAGGGMAIKAEHISRQIDLLIGAQDQLEVKDWIKWFLEIHPFEDGNGRTAAILFNYMNGDLSAPQTLPEFEFV